MQITRADLERSFQRMGDEELLAHYRSGTLTDLAMEVALAELSRRGVSVDPEPEPESEPVADDHSDSDDSDGADLVLLARYTAPTEAHILSMLLESRGIFAAVIGANYMQAVTPWEVNTLGGVRVMVPLAQAEEALALFAQYKKGELKLPEE